MTENAGKLFLPQPSSSQLEYALKVGVEKRISLPDAPAAEHRIERLHRTARSGDPHDLGAEVGKQHAAKGRRAQAGEFQYANALQRAVRGVFGL